MVQLLAVIVAALTYFSPAQATEKISDFRTAKSLLKQAPSETTFYCSCPIIVLADGMSPDVERCSYTPPQSRTGAHDRAYRIEYEHVMPASQFGHTRACWKQDLDHDGRWDGRKACRKQDAVFREMEGDINNLVPVIGLLNAKRSNYPYGEIVGEARNYGDCDFEISNQTVEPRPEIRGDIARIIFYMGHTYGIPVPDSELAILLKWHENDPVSAEEVERAEKNVRLGARPNPYILGLSTN